MNTSANRRKPSARIFEVLPPSGILLPGQKVNVQVKFTPIEEVIELFIPLFKITNLSICLD